jgi:hypothetical protein
VCRNSRLWQWQIAILAASSQRSRYSDPIRRDCAAAEKHPLPASMEMPFSAGTIRVLQFAEEEARA